MPRRLIERIRDAIRTGNYDMTTHALEEMAEDNLRISDVENAILTGKIENKQKGDLRGIKYVIHGVNGTQSISIGVVGRFKETGVFLILTVYEI